MIRKIFDNIKAPLSIYFSREILRLVAELKLVRQSTCLLGTVPVQDNLIDPPTEFAGQNLSLVREDDGWRVAIRKTNAICSPRTLRLEVPGGRHHIDSQTIIGSLDPELKEGRYARLDDSPYRDPSGLARNGFEDPRMFRWRGDLWCLWTATQILTDDWSVARNTMALGRIVEDRISELEFLPSPHGRRREKNWMPWIVDEKLFLIYDIENMEIYAWEKNSLHLRHRAERPEPQLRGWTGSSPLQPWGEHWICVVHYAARVARTALFKLGNFYYLHRLVIIGRDFQVLATSREFFFRQKGVEFCTGLAVVEGDVFISYSVGDRESHVMKLTVAAIESLFNGRE